MAPIVKHPFQKWEVSIIKIEAAGVKYKVTRRLAELSVAETKFFTDLKEAKQQFEEWLK